MDGTKRKALAIINFFLFLGMLAMNWLANAQPINHLTTAQVSDMYSNLFVPAGFTFAIWGLIYFFLACFTIYALVQAFKKNARAKPLAALDKIAVLFGISCVLNMSWIWVWHHLMPGLALVIMLGLLITLCLIFKRLLPYRNNMNGTDSLFLRLPFTIYLGWISVATIANVTAWLVSIKWGGAGLSADTWAKIMVVTAGALAMYMLVAWRQSAFAVVVVWACYGINEKQESTGGTVDDFALFCAVVLLIGAFVSAVRQTSVMRKIKNRVGSLR